MPSELTKKIHQELCPDVDINSVEFTFRIIEEITKIKKELKLEGDRQAE